MFTCNYANNMEQIVLYNGIQLDDTGTAVWIGDNEIPDNYSNYGTTATITLPIKDFFSRLFELHISNSNESLLVGAVRNLTKKLNLIELEMSLENEEIDEDQFEIEIENNEHKYTIRIHNQITEMESICITRLMQKIGHDVRDYTTSEVSEMFGVNEDVLLSKVNDLKQIR